MNRRGISNLELIAAAAVLLTVLTVITSLCFQISRVWVDVRHHRVAMAELSSQLDWLTRVETEDLQSELGKLRVSEFVRRTLPNATLSGKVVDSELGQQITLGLTWPTHVGRPIELTGWRVAEGDAANELKQGEQP